MHALLPLATFFVDLLILIVAYCVLCAVGRIFHVLWTLSIRADQALAGVRK